VIADLAQAHDCTLAAVADTPPSQDITAAERRLLAAQEQVMRELASLGGVPTWVGIT
jgi:hypothetical protein